ncbi:TIGR00266 family protein [Spirochaeta cellobiosiphila]|uniref:TIGR00266 family protein n=1 Tax=Spirochaeta cellobiosiphila TaxID=504483 RepID=UPI00041B21EE|nr:TIGR00266 family protein [Spirochaeta cellobiosiphila]
MTYSIENQPVFTTVTVKLDAGETIKAEGGAMISMTSNIDLKSKSSGKGIFGMIKAAIGGEGLLQTHFTAEGESGEVTFAPKAPGDVLAVDVSDKTIFAQNGAWMAGSTEVQMSAQGSLKAMASGEGLFLQKIYGKGTVFLSSFGSIIEKELAPGETYILDTGNMLAYEETVSQRVRKASKGLISSFTSKEGLVAEFTGPGKVWMETRNLKGFAGVISSLTGSKFSVK